MEFEGKVVQILAATTGTSARGPWQRQDVVFEMPQEFSRKVCVKFFNKPDDVAKLRVGGTYTVSFNLESREFNGRWYTDVSAWRVQSKEQQAAPASAAPMSADLPPIGGEEPIGVSAAAEVDDLPF